MEKKYINLNNLPKEKIMTSYEMKNIVGGTSGKCNVGPSGFGYCEGHEGKPACSCQNDRWCIGNCA